ncbi:MAG: nitrilase family protein [Ferruginibacter sp.]
MPPLTITTIQTNLFWENKGANLDALEKKISSLPEKTEIIVLPEMFSTGFSMHPKQLAETMDGETVQWMKAVAAINKIILTGSLIIEENDNYFNRLIWMLPNGQFGYYDKRHLFAYAQEDLNYTAGNRRLIASVKGWKINLQICYDLRFPVWARNNILPISNPPAQASSTLAGTEMPPAFTPEYDILIYVANWPEKRNHAWKTLLCARAIENQCYVVGVNRVGRDGNNIDYSGNSLVIDPLGEVLYHKADEEDIFTIKLEKEHLEEIRAKFPFWRDGDEFILR